MVSHIRHHHYLAIHSRLHFLHLFFETRIEYKGNLSVCESGAWSCSDSGCGSDFVCPSNQIRSDHVTQCEPKCSTLHHITTQPGACDGPVWSGCKCPAGLVRVSFLYFCQTIDTFWLFTRAIKSGLRGIDYLIHNTVAMKRVHKVFPDLNLVYAFW